MIPLANTCRKKIEEGGMCPATSPGPPGFWWTQLRHFLRCQLVLEPWNDNCAHVLTTLVSLQTSLPPSPGSTSHFSQIHLFSCRCGPITSSILTAFIDTFYFLTMYWQIFLRCGVTTGAKQSWNYEWVWSKRTFEGLCSNPMLKVGPVLPSLLVAFVHLSFWYLQGWQFRCLSGSVSWYLTTP